MKKHTTWVLLLLLIAARAMGGNSPYINRVYEYRPAPGQFVNLLPRYEAGDTEEDMLGKVSQLIVDTLGTYNYISLGGWGGYVVFGFDHTIINIPGEADFEVGGNYFPSQLIANPFATRNPDGTYSHDSIRYGSSEPGIIYVSRDENGNGLPDDTWYEIAGSEYPYARTGYSVTYERPLKEDGDVLGMDIDELDVTIYHNSFHTQPYYPQWVSEDMYTLTGSLLPSNLAPATTILLTLDYGYADNASNGTPANAIHIDWAVDEQGQPAQLTGIDFVKVQTGVAQDGGPMGETSTEVTGARDLHPDAMGLSSISKTDQAEKVLLDGQIYLYIHDRYYDILGRRKQ